MNHQTTIIGPNTHIRGTVEGEEDLTVQGRIDGNISLSKTLFVDPNGIIVADVQAHQAVVSGSVIGTIHATELIHITEEGRVVGDLSAPRIILAEGAALRGNIDMGDLDELRAPKEAQPVAISAPVKTPARIPPTRYPSTTVPSRRPPMEPSPTVERSALAPSRTVPRATTGTTPLSTPGVSPATQTAKLRTETPARPKVEAPASSFQPIIGEEIESESFSTEAANDKLTPDSAVPKPPTAAGKKSRIKRK